MGSLTGKAMVNLTPHELKVHTADSVMSLPPKLPAVRVGTERERVGELVWPVGSPMSGWVSVVRTKMGDVEGLPPRDPDVILIVSALVAEHPRLAARDDLAYPGEAVRDHSGRVVGCRGLCAGPGLAKRLAIGE